MKLTFVLVLWCSVALTNCTLDFDKTLALGAYKAEMRFKDAIYFSLKTLKTFLPPDKRVSLSSAYGEIDGGRLQNQLTIDFTFLTNMYGFTQPSFMIDHTEYFGIVETCQKVVTLIQDAIFLATALDRNVEDFTPRINKCGDDINNSLAQLRNDLSEYFTRSGELDASHIGFENYLQEDPKMPAMYLKDAVDIAANTWAGTIELREFLMDERFDVYDVRNIIQIMPVLHTLKFIKNCIDVNNVIEVNFPNYDFIVDNCAFILIKQKKIEEYRQQIREGRQFENSVRGIIVLTKSMKAIIDEIIYKFYLNYPQLVANFEELTSTLNNDCITWRDKISENSSGEMEEVLEFKGMIVNIAECVGKMNVHLQQRSGSKHEDIKDYYVVTNYPFVVGAFYYLIKTYLDEWHFAMPLSDEAFLEFRISHDLMSTNVTSLVETIDKLKTTAPGKKGKKLRGELTNLLRETQENAVNAFYNICDCLLRVPSLSDIEDPELIIKRDQYIAAIKEIKAFREDVKWKEDKKRKHDSMSQDDTSAD